MTALLLLTIATASHAQETDPLIAPMVADISQNTIEIHSSFNGAQLLIFGARNQPGELVIVVRGPSANLHLRRKERIAGMWMHVEKQKYEAVPLFYAIASTRPLAEIAPPLVLASLGLGAEHVIQSNNPSSKAVFDTALQEIFSKQRTWQTDFSPITYFGESLFKAKLTIPDTLPDGSFTTEIYLFDRGKLISAQTIPLRSYKTGFDARVFTNAQHRPWIYGISAILLALSGGWLAHRMFNRRD
jgi:uncharacterized protein (TIGR02186 family)